MAFLLKGHAEETLERLVKAFEDGSVAPAIAHTVIGRAENRGDDPADARPIDRWSWNNALMARLFAVTDDARTFKQWLGVGRVVQKGSKATHLLAPILRNGKSEDEDTGEVRRYSYIAGFKTFAVFAIEQTDVLDDEKWKGEAGKQFVAPDYSPVEPPPLWDVAAAWNIDVRYAPFKGQGYGWCTVEGSAIGLGTHDVGTWIHELAHAAEARLNGRLKGGQRPDQEIVAELTAAAICSMLGIEGREGTAFEYIRHYAEKSNETPSQACLKVLGRVQATIEHIIECSDMHEDKLKEAA